MHVSAIDAPSDIYGAVTDVSRPLIYKLNQASMQRSVYDALYELLTWAVAQLEQGMSESLSIHEANEANGSYNAKQGVVLEVAHTETPVAALAEPVQWHDVLENSTPAGEAVASAPEDIVPLTADMLDETAEDAAIEAEVAIEVAKPKASRVAKPT